MEVDADGLRVVGVDGAVAFLDVTDDSLFVDDDVGPLRPLEFLALNIIGFQNAVSGEHFVIHIAEEREADADLLGEGGVGGRTIDANAENRGIGSVDLS